MTIIIGLNNFKTSIDNHILLLLYIHHCSFSTKKIVHSLFLRNLWMDIIVLVKLLILIMPKSLAETKIA